MPKGIRPTQNKVRKAVFDILGDVTELSFLELYAGSGAVALEAVSRGVSRAAMVEQDRFSVAALNSNIGKLGVSAVVSVYPLGAEEAIKRMSRKGEKFDVIFLDPPYIKAANSPSPAKKTLQTIAAYDILAPSGFIIVQHHKKDNLPDAPGELILWKRSRYGDTALSFYTFASRRSHPSACQ